MLPYVIHDFPQSFEQLGRALSLPQLPAYFCRVEGEKDHVSLSLHNGILRSKGNRKLKLFKYNIRALILVHKTKNIDTRKSKATKVSIKYTIKGPHNIS
jgi:hypothetical protein